jgi:transcriptional regulator
MRHAPDYALTDVDAVRALAREHPWMSLTSFVPGRGLVSSHYPVLLDEDADGIVLLSHVGRPDERVHELGAHEVLVTIAGPNGYISPGWYGVSPAVPTWNFVVAHCYGVPEILSDAENLAVLDAMVARFESVLPEPFLMAGTLENAAYAERIVGGTVGFRLRVTRFEAKEKMSQDKPVAVVDRILDQLRRTGPYAHPALADRMQHVRDARPAPDPENA